MHRDAPTAHHRLIPAGDAAGRRPGEFAGPARKPAADADRPASIPDALLELQRTAGNQAVAGMIPALQRKGGWSDAMTGEDESSGVVGWNAATHDTADGAVRRIPIEGLKGGNQKAWQGGFSATLTDESAKGRAIVMVPAALKTGLPIDAMLVFHGYAEQKGRPYAGWRTRRSDNTVRDVAQDQLEQQLAASGATQMIGVLPQGGEESQFNKEDFDTDAYLDEVFGKLLSEKELALPKGKDHLERGRVIVSGHSGGSHIMKAMITKAGGARLPAKLGELVIYDAINKGEGPAFAAFVTDLLDQDLAAVTDGTLTDAKKREALSKVPTFRGYYSTVYESQYSTLQKAIDRWFGKHRDELGSFAGDVEAKVQIIPAGVGGQHEAVMRGHKLGDPSSPGEGNVTDAIRSMYAPKIRPVAAPTAVPRKVRATKTAPKATPKAVVPAAAPRRTPTAVRSRRRRAAAPAVTDATDDKAAGAAAVMSPKRREALIAAATEQALKGGESKEDREALAADLLASKGTPSVKAWFAGMVPDASFLGVSVDPSGGSAAPGVHAEMLAALHAAEAALLAKHPGRAPADLAHDLKIKQIVGLRVPKKATGGTRVSMHCFGMAVDINYYGNPFVGEGRNAGAAATEMIKRATLLMRGAEVNIRAAPSRMRRGGTADSEVGRGIRAERAGLQWERHHDASEALREYLNLTEAELAARIRDGAGGDHDLDWWKASLASDRRASRSGNFRKHADPATAGFMDLPKELVTTLVEAGLTWGGSYNTSKDLMHFDLRTGSVTGREVA